MMMGTGNKYILTSCENRGLKRPEIIEKNDFFEVKLFEPKEDSLVNNKKLLNLHGRLRTIRK